METRQVRLVDAFAAEPLGGIPIPVLPDGGAASGAQLRAVASEFGAPGAVTPAEDGFRFVAGHDGAFVGVAAVAGATGLLEADVIDTGEYTLTMAADGIGGYPVAVTANRTVSVSLPEHQVRETDLSLAEIARCIDMPTSALESVSDDIPPGIVEQFGGTLYVTVNYLEHLTGAEPAGATLAERCAAAGVDRFVALTFDTLEAGNDVHLRIFDADGGAAGHPSAGVVAGGCGAFLADRRAFEGEVDGLRVETGYFRDRPASITTTLSKRPDVSGHAITTVEGTIAMPADDDDDIIVV